MTIMKTRPDAEIRRLVTQDLEWDPRIADSSGITVRVKDGVVTLEGHVDSYAERLAARRSAHQIEGVLDVLDELAIKPTRVVKDDHDLALAVRQALTWSAFLPDSRIKSTVSGGWVTLEGEVDRLYQKDDAARVVGSLKGVRGVTNQVVVKPEFVDPTGIRASIEGALTRRAKREAKRIRVDVVGSVVKLSGKVDSLAERRLLEIVAHFSPGVSKIENAIVVDPYL